MEPIQNSTELIRINHIKIKDNFINLQNSLINILVYKGNQ